MKIPMTYSDSVGETHFGELDLPEIEAAVGPPPNPLGLMSDLGAIKNAFLYQLPAGVFVPTHNAPQPYIAICLSGEIEVTASDGTVRHIKPGGLMSMGDLTGKGHSTRTLSDTVTLFLNRATA